MHRDPLDGMGEVAAEGALPAEGHALVSASLPLVLRAPENTRELNFVRSSWTKSEVHVLLDGCEAAGVGRIRRTRARMLMWGHGRHVDRILERPGVTVTVADTTAAPGTLVGWLCREGDTLHYVYVGATFRRMGVARVLVGAMALQPVVFTAWTPVVERMKLPKQWNWDDTRRWV